MLFNTYHLLIKNYNYFLTSATFSREKKYCKCVYCNTYHRMITDNMANNILKEKITIFIIVNCNALQITSALFSVIKVRI